MQRALLESILFRLRQHVLLARRVPPSTLLELPSPLVWLAKRELFQLVQAKQHAQLAEPDNMLPLPELRLVSTARPGVIWPHRLLLQIMMILPIVCCALLVRRILWKVQGLATIVQQDRPVSAEQRLASSVNLESMPPLPALRLARHA